MRKSLMILPAALAVGIAGCGASYSAGTPASASASAAAGKHAVVNTRHGKLGTFLVDGRGRTLYLFRKDTSAKSRCSGSCAALWPPLITREKPEAEGGAKAAMLSTSKRSGGARQVVYNGHPLYRYSPDTAAGQTHGQGVDTFGARWYVVSTSGRAITAVPGGSSTPSPYGY